MNKITTVPGQLYACLSVVGPEAPQKNDKFGIKIRGAFNSRDEAASHAKRLQKEDATFDIYVVDMYKWLLIPPDPAKIEDAHYANEKLEELMTGYRENQAQAAQMFAERKRDMMENGSMMKPGDENRSIILNQTKNQSVTHLKSWNDFKRKNQILQWKNLLKRRILLSQKKLKKEDKSVKPRLKKLLKRRLRKEV